MVRKLIAIAFLAVSIQAVLIESAFAQDFSSLVSQASTANQLWVSQIDQTLQATDLATLHSRASTALATGQQVQSLLRAALPLAPDDASRSRVEALLTHVSAAIQAGQQAVAATDFDLARSQVNAERGEAQEALNELAPFAPQATPTAAPVTTTPVPVTTLPVTGGLPIGPVVALGLLASLIGVGLRRQAS